MLRRLRLRITLLAALLTGVVLAAVLSVACRIAGEQYTTGRLDAFDTAVNQLQYRWEQFNQLEDSWLQQLEAENGVLIQLEENGHPLLYSKRRSTADQTLLQAVRDTAEQHYTVNLSSRPLAEPNTQQPNFSLTAPDGQVYRCTLRLNLSANRWTTLLAAQNLTVEQTYLNHLGLRFSPEHTTIQLQLVQASGRVQFRVIDQGPGVALPHRKRIFDRFYSEPSDGIRPHCGLGLAVARELALLHGGRIWVQDTPGGGATFCVELPSKKRGVASCTGTESGRWQ